MNTILFICTHNAGRSQMAEAFFNSMVKGKVKAVSAGTTPAAQVNPSVVKVMREEGLDIENNKPKLLTLELMEQADRVITMGCGADKMCPASFVPTEDWALDDPEGKTLDEVRVIRDQVKLKISNLVKEID